MQTRNGYGSSAIANKNPTQAANAHTSFGSYRSPVLAHDALAALMSEMDFRIAQGLVVNPPFIGAIAASVGVVPWERMTSAGDKAESALKHLKERITGRPARR